MNNSILTGKDLDEIDSYIIKENIYCYRLYLQDKNIKADSITKRYKQNSIRCVVSDLYGFAAYLYANFKDLDRASEINTTHIIGYISYCTGILHNSNRTTNRKIRSIKHFFDYLVSRHVIRNDPSANIEYLKQHSEEHPKFITKGALNSILEVMNTFKYGIRDVCITDFIANTGLSLQEVFDLRTSNIDVDMRNLFIIRKDSSGSNNKYNIHISGTIYVHLMQYLKLRNELVIDNSDVLFLSHTGLPYPIRAYQYKLNNAIAKSNIRFTCKPSARNIKALFCYSMAKTTPPYMLKSMLNQDKVEHYYIDDESHVKITN